MPKVSIHGNQLTLPDDLRELLTTAEDDSLEAEEVVEGILLRRSPSARRKVGLAKPLSGIVRDPNDDMIIAAAIDGRADTIVSRDKDLLSIGVYQDISIITPEVFRQQLRDIVQSD